MLSKVYSRYLRPASAVTHLTAKNLKNTRHCSSVQKDERTNSEESTAEEPLIMVEKFEFTTLIGLNRPAKRNALNEQLVTSLRQAISDYESDSNARSAVLYGVGGNFCAGLDLEEISASDKFERPVLPLVDLPLTKPIVASVNGYAVAEGFMLALACDAQIIEETAVVGLFNRRFGVPLTDDTIARLVAYIGFPRAMDLILTGRPVRAKEALKMGLASEIIPCGSARGRSLSLARSLVKFPQAALLADRAALYAAFGSSENIRQTARTRMEVLRAQAFKEIPGNAASFKQGLGRHGTAKFLADFQEKNWLP